VVAGGSDAGQTGGKPPAWQAALWWLDLATGALTKTLVVPAGTPQAPGFAGQKTSLVLDLTVAASGALVAVGWTGAAAEPTFGIDAAVWALDAAGVVQSTVALGAAGKDLLAAALRLGDQVWLYGTLAADGATSDAVAGLWSPPVPDCDDGNPATVDACDALNGCTHTPL
jgi:hypothetical protein